jgi:DNA ligase (NAD+)
MTTKQLEQQIEDADRAYWILNEPIMSDADYDKLVQQLPAGHALRSKLHDHQLLSLDKVYTVDELKSWCKKVSRSREELFVCEAKYDGLTAVVEEHALWTKRERRDNARPFISGLKVGHGEIVVLKSALGLATRSGGDPYKTCRSAAAGLVNTVDRPGLLHFMPFGAAIIGEFDLFDSDNLDFILDVLAEEQEKDYPIDGLVISLADKEYGASLGNTEHHPNHSIALKSRNPSTTAKVLDVVWQNGKASITPVAILEATELDGVTIERATLHNWGYLQTLQPILGAMVTLERAGSVIPQITKVVTPGKHHAMTPDECPACGSLPYGDDIHLTCINPHCGGAAAKKLRDAMVRVGIENLGPSACSDLVAAGFRDLVALYHMTPGQWGKLPGFAEKSAMAAYHHVQSILGRPIQDFKLLASLNIPGIGISLSKKICDKVGVEDFATASFEEIEGIGAARAAELREALGSMEWIDMLMTFKVVGTKGSLSAPIIVMTGAGPQPRGELEKIAVERGYAVGKSVTKATALLVCASLDSGSSKLKKATAYGVEIKTYGDWL